jgi:hypothetical protein
MQAARAACGPFPVAQRRRCGYLRSLPAREYLPVYWSDQQLQLLQGTELEGTVTDRHAARRRGASRQSRTLQPAGLQAPARHTDPSDMMWPTHACQAQTAPP